jgi:hypothetical protein
MSHKKMVNLKILNEETVQKLLTTVKKSKFYSGIN